MINEKAEVKDVSNKITNFTMEINKIQDSRKKEEQDREKQRIVSKYKGCEGAECEKAQQKVVETHRNDLNALTTDILNLKDNFASKIKENRDSIHGMSHYLSGINKITACIRQKELYEQLLSQAPQKSDEAEQKIAKARDLLVKKLLQLKI